MTAIAQAPYGSGLYRRGRIWWVRIRTPRPLIQKISLRDFFRFSTGTTSLASATRRAAHLRAALDRGFALVRLEMSGVVQEAVQVEAMIVRLAHAALAEAETARAWAGPRSDAQIADAIAAHEEARYACRNALRRNDFSRISGRVALASAEVGLRSDHAADPRVLREAARMLACVAEENIAREQGIYRTDAEAMSDRMAAASRPRGAAVGGIAGHASRHESPRMTSDVALTSFDITLAWQPEKASPDVDGTAQPLPSKPSPPAPAPHTDAGHATEASEVPLQPASDPGGSATPDRTAETSGNNNGCPPRKRTAKIRTRKVPGASKRDWVKEIQRHLGGPDVQALRKLEGEVLLDISLRDAFLIDAATRAEGGKNTSWIRNSWRGHQAAAHLFISFVEQDLGHEARVRDVTRYHGERFPELLEDLPNTWNKGADLRGTLEELIEMAAEEDLRRAAALEIQAHAEDGDEETLEEEKLAARMPRTAPATNYKHQSYVKAALDTIFRRSGAEGHPIPELHWSKKELRRRQAMVGDARTALGGGSRARLFSSRAFRPGGSNESDPLFWAPLLARYAGCRMEEVLQLGPKDIRQEEGVWVIDIHERGGNTLKSASSARLVPIHSELVRLGLLDLARRRKAGRCRRLLDVTRGPDGKFTTRFSKTYHNYRKSEQIYEAGKDFHSLRKDFYQSMPPAATDLMVRIQLMGHARTGVSEEFYRNEGFPVHDLKQAIDTIIPDTLHVRPRMD